MKTGPKVSTVWHINFLGLKHQLSRWVVSTNIFTPTLGDDSIWLVYNMFQLRWFNHHLALIFSMDFFFEKNIASVILLLYRWLGYWKVCFSHLQNGSSDLPSRELVHIPPGEVHKNIIDLKVPTGWYFQGGYPQKLGPKSMLQIWFLDIFGNCVCRHGWGDTYESNYWCFTRVWLQGHLSTTPIFSTYQIPWCQKWDALECRRRFGIPLGSSFEGWILHSTLLGGWWIHSTPLGWIQDTWKTHILDPKTYRYLEKKLRFRGMGSSIILRFSPLIIWLIY